MRRNIWIGLTALPFMLAGTAHAADIGTAFTYQGFLEKPAGTPVTNTCDLEFSLWDATGSGSPPAGGNQIGTTQTVLGVMVSNGVFTVGPPDVDFGSGAFNGQARWLEIHVKCPPDGGFSFLSPRVELTPTPHALALPGLYTQQNATSPNVIGGYEGNTVGPGVYGATIGGGGAAGFPNRVTDLHGTVSGGLGNQAGDNGGVTFDRPYATVGGGFSNTASGRNSTVGGGFGNAASEHSAAVGGGYSNAASSTYATIGGGYINNANGSVSTIGGGYQNTASGDYATVGGGDSNTASGYSATVGSGERNTASGLASTIGGGGGNTASGYSATVPGGVENLAGGDYSLAAGRRAKVRDALAAGEVPATCSPTATCGDEGTFVWADSNFADFTSTGPNQFLIRASGGVGMGTNSPAAQLHTVEATLSRPAIRGVQTVTSNNQPGVYGRHAVTDGFGLGVHGIGGSVGVWGEVFSAGNGSYYGVYGQAIGGTGTNYGVAGFASGGATTLAGAFFGDVEVTGNLSKGGGAFKIDHPLDPENKYLYHSFVESPDMKNIYDGVATLDAEGTAWVQMPEWFEALNRDFRYQLTCIGGFAPVYVSRKVAENRFQIAGGSPGMEVSWTVTGIRQDAYANAHRIPVEETKASRDRGKFLHPAALGQPEELGIDFAHRRPTGQKDVAAGATTERNSEPVVSKTGGEQ